MMPTLFRDELFLGLGVSVRSSVQLGSRRADAFREAGRVADPTLLGCPIPATGSPTIAAFVIVGVSYGGDFAFLHLMTEPETAASLEPRRSSLSTIH